MSEPSESALLPAGLRDVLPPDAAYEAAVTERLLAVFARHGYERVKPPLVEFEDSLLSGPGAAVAEQTFRLMDPISQRMMGLRADVTTQVARIAVTRLAKAPRPLRLSYAGQVLRVRGSQLRPDRQITQVGVELIGAPDGAEADAEVVMLAGEALGEIGVAAPSVDLNFPPMAAAVCAGLGLDAATTERLRAPLDHKDEAAVMAIGGPAAAPLRALLRAAGPADAALEALRAIALPEAAAAARDRLSAVVALVRQAAPASTVTIDPLERRGFEYHTGLGLTLFAAGVHADLGHGGRYLAGDVTAGGPCQPATGFTLYLDSVLRALPGPVPGPRLFLPHGTPAAEAARLRAEGWVTLNGLTPVPDAKGEAARLGCSHCYVGGDAVAVDGTGAA